jgi:PAS domain S-box-containing protein
MTKEDAIKKRLASLRKKAEKQLQNQSTGQDSISPEHAQGLLHELQVHQIELEMQNEELGRAQVGLEISRTKYFDLFDLAPVGYLTLSEKGLIMEANLTASKLLGVERSSLVKQTINHFIHHIDKDLYYLHSNLLLKTGIPQVCEIRMTCRDSSYFWARLESTRALEDESGRTIIRTVLSDITERKRVEEELKKHRDHLEDLVKERTAKLLKAIEQMEKQIEERKRVEDALRVNEEIFRIHFSLSNDVMFTSNDEFKILSVTPNVERVLGYKPKELVGRTFQEVNVLHPDDMGRAYENYEHVLSGGASRHLIFRFITKDGNIKFGEVSGVPLTKKGYGTTLISVARDVTERIEHEQVLMETLDRYNTHFTLTDDVMFSFDHKLRFNSISPNVEKVTGYKPEELIGKPAHKLGVFPPEYQGEAYDEAIHLLSGQTFNYSIYEFITKDGKRKFGEFSSSPLKRDGRVVEIITVAREITERIKKERSLQETEATAQALVNACIDSMVLIDITGTILYINKAASERLGRSVKELLVTCIFDHLPKEVADRRKIYLEQVISSGNPIRFEDEDRGRLMHSSLFPIYNEQGKVTRIAIHVQDITELKQAFFKSKI